MPYAEPFMRLVMIGTLYGVEDFSFSVNFISETGAQASPPLDQGVIDACTLYFSNNLAPISQNALLTQIKLNLIGVDGRYVQQSTEFHDVLPPLPGGSSSNVAAQLALCVSTVTAVTRGPASKGRWFLPIPGAQVDSAGQISEVYRDAAANAAATWLASLNAHFGDWQAGVVSNVGTGSQHPITAVRVGKVLDTMRSRREKIPEAYEVRPI